MLQFEGKRKAFRFAGLYGLVKKFITTALEDYGDEADRPAYCVSRRNRAIMRQRGKEIRLTAEFGRPYRCVVTEYRLFQLDDWLHFLETFSLYIFRGLLPPIMEEMWLLLR